MVAISLPYSAAEALQEVRSLIDESTAGFWTDAEINNWVIDGAVDISAKTLCYEHKNSIKLVASQLEYNDFVSAPASNGIAQVLEVYRCVYDDESNVYRSLQRIHPRQIGRLSNSTAGPPHYYYHFGGKIGLFPLPTATEIALTDPVLVHCSLVADAITDLPNHYHQFAVVYAAAMARFKERKNTEAMALYTKYINAMNFHRADIYDRPGDAKTDMQTPDIRVRAGGE